MIDTNINAPQTDLLFSFKNNAVQRSNNNQDRKWYNAHYFVIRNLIFLIFLLFGTNWVKWEKCTEDVFPIVHGKYYSKIDDKLYVHSEFEYCHAESFDLKDLNVYNNDDILITYISIIVHKYNHTNFKLLYGKWFNIFMNFNSKWSRFSSPAALGWI